MALTPEQVRHVAHLARLSLTPKEEETLGHQLSAILDAVDQLKALDTEGVEPTSHATLLETALREDVPHASLGTQKALANAPAPLDGHFAVPKVIE